jgi:hypothetical protein
MRGYHYCVLMPASKQCPPELQLMLLCPLPCPTQGAIVELLEKGASRGKQSAELQLSGTKPAVVLIVGVNGAGKVGRGAGCLN